MSIAELPLTVFVVDDEPPARNRLKDLLTDCNAQLPLEMVGEAGNGREALDKLSEINGKIWIQENRTDVKVDEELVAAGVLSKDIISGLQHPTLQRLTQQRATA